MMSSILFFSFLQFPVVASVAGALSRRSDGLVRSVASARSASRVRLLPDDLALVVRDFGVHIVDEAPDFVTIKTSNL